MEHPLLPFLGTILSRKKGGFADCKTYCRYWVRRPPIPSERLLCAGGELWSPCPDYETCSGNKPEREVRDTKKPQPNYSLRDGVRARQGDDDGDEDRGKLPDDAD